MGDDSLKIFSLEERLDKSDSIEKGICLTIDGG